MSGIRRVRHLVYLIVALLAVTNLGLRGLALWSEHRSALRWAEASARDLARIVEEHAHRILDTGDLVIDQVVEGIARRGGVMALRGDEEAFRWLRRLASRLPGGYILVVDPNGVPVALSEAHPAPETPLADRPWFRAHVEGAERHIGEALVSRLTRDVLSTYSRALHGAGGALEGVVQIALRPGFFQDLALGTETVRGANLGLWTPEGRVIARTGLTPEQIGRISLAPEVLERALAGQAGALRLGAREGRDRLVAFRPLEGRPAIATVSVPVESALVPFRRDLVWSLWLGGFVLVALGGLAWVAGALSRREERTLAELAAANAALRQARGALEARVAERTAALAEANRRLREKEARFRGIFNAQFQFIGLLSPDGTLLEANETALAFAGLAPEAVIGRPFAAAPWWEGGDEAARARLEEAIRRAAQGAFVRYETEARGAGGRAATLDFSLKPLRDETGAVVLLVAEGRDISELKAAQAQLHEAQKLETLGQLTGGVAHDFNNLLMAVLGNLGLLRKRLPDDPRLRRLLEGAVQGAERGAALTQRLLAFARRQELRPQAIELGALVRGMTELLRRSLGPAIRIAVDIPPGLPPVRADANQLEMALLNLAVNARDAMPMGGSLLIEARDGDAPGVERPEGLPRGRFVRLSVADSGTGMDAETLKRATEPFFTTKGPGKGSGLGLSMVHGLAAQSGGRLVIESEPGRGTTVALWLPVAEAATSAGPPPGPAAESPPPPAGRRTILLVDDDPLIQAGTAAMLEDLGHDVRLAGSGLAALEALAAGPVELVLTDYAMPGMNGLDLARRIRERYPALPVVIVTGYADLPGEAAAEFPRLAKPYRQEDLAAAIARALGPRQGARVVKLPLPQRG
ncbi:hybrid sensor histidine kinase/response regulator [Crenalkalicoccus roseus]|uniref:hybrid sensor histidine kinase/response regulator n=1 Tax=Crenalkalicoccus roseus TaxID=1485588 RepID=UPI0010806567|nr:hybrid sensor histidine kinase/response regulator [Crenalkalicoccus roseus]